jgi:hypothetical protein
MIKIPKKLKGLTDEELWQKVTELRNEFKELTKNQTRQHGRKGESHDDPIKEIIRLTNNIASVKTRNKHKEIEKQQDIVFKESLGFRAEDTDEYGIKAVDERRYIKCFRSGYINAPVYRTYIKRMTGLSLYQMFVLQERTGYIPTPKITKVEAKKNERELYERGDIYQTAL